MKHYGSLFLTAFLQVFFVACNTYFLSRTNYSGALICGFLISWLWAANVKRVSIGSTADRLTYASGAAAGSVGGLFVSATILKLF